MNLTKFFRKVEYFAVFVPFFVNFLYADVPEWYTRYEAGLKAQGEGNWEAAVENFREAVRLKDDETSKTRAFGAVFIEYFPHRELGISYYHLGKLDEARKELEYSLSKKSTLKAKEYLKKIEEGEPPAVDESKSNPVTTDVGGAAAITAIPPITNDAALVGERLSIAVLPFTGKGIGQELGQIGFFDKLITAFVNSKRFKVFERAQLQKILEEQQLGLSGVVDISTAARLGKGIGVDAVVFGSITRSGNSVSIDARLIDTETTAIISAKDAFSM